MNPLGEVMDGDLLPVLSARVDRLEQFWDRSAALDPAMLGIAVRLAQVLREEDLDGWRTLGRFYNQRCIALFKAGNPDATADDSEAMLDAFLKCFVAGGDIPEDMRYIVAMYATDSADELWRHAEQSLEVAPMTAAALLWQRIIAATPVDSPSRAEHLSYLCSILASRYKRSGDPADLDSAITIGCQAAEIATTDDETRSLVLFNLGVALLDRSQLTNSEEDLDAAVTAYQQAADGVAEDALDRADYHSGLSSALRARFERTGDRPDLDAAIIADRRAIDAGTAEAALGMILLNAGNTLLTRYSLDGNHADLEEAVRAFRQAAEASSGDDRLTAACLNSLGNGLMSRFQLTGDLSDIDEAVALGRRSAAVAPPGDDQVTCLLSLGSFVMTRAQRAGARADIDEAVSLLQRADTLPDGHRLRAPGLANLGSALLVKFEQTGDRADLDAAVAATLRAADVTPAGHPGQAICLRNASVALGTRFEWAGQVADIEESLSAARRMMRALPEGHPHRASGLSLLSGTLLDWCRAKNQYEGLDEAIAFSREAVQTLPDGHPEQARACCNLGIALRARFERTSDQADLDNAIALFRRSLECSGDGHPDEGLFQLGLGSALVDRYERTSDPDDLNAAIAVMRSALDTSPSRGRRIEIQVELGVALRLRFELAGDRTDLDEAVALTRQAAEATPVGHVHQRSIRSSLGAALSAQASQGQNSPAESGRRTRPDLIAAMAMHLSRIEPPDMSLAPELDALEDARCLAEILASEDGDDMHAWAMLGTFHLARAVALPEASGERDEALAAAVRAYLPRFLAGLDVPAPVLPAFLQEVGRLVEQAIYSYDVDLINRAVRAARVVMEAIHDDDPDRTVYVSLVGCAHLIRFRRTGDRADLDEAIACIEAAVSSVPADDSRLPAMCAMLAEALQYRFEHASNLADLERAVVAGQRAVAGGVPGDLHQAAFVAIVARALLLRVRHTGGNGLADVDAAIAMLVQSVGDTRANPGACADCQARLSDAWLDRFGFSGDPADLDRAVAHARDAVQQTPEGRPSLTTRIEALGTALRRRAEQNGKRADLDEAITTTSKAIEATLADDPSRALLLHEMGAVHWTRYSWTGDRADLDASTAAFEEAMKGLPVGHISHAMLTDDLSSALLARFWYGGGHADLDRAIVIGRQAVAETPASHPGRAKRLCGVGRALLFRYLRSGRLPDLAEAIAMSREAVAAAPDGHPDRAMCLSSLSIALSGWSEATEDAASLDEAIAADRQAAAALPESHRHWPGTQASLGIALLARFEFTDDPADLVQATAVLRAGIASMPEDDPARPPQLSALAGVLEARAGRTGDAECADEAASLYMQVAQSPMAVPSIRIEAARAAASITADSAPGDAASLLEMAVRLLPQAAGRPLTQADRQHQLSRFSFLASDAAALTLAADGPHPAARALGLLELGRAFLHGQALDTRTDLTGLHTSHPALASRFVKLLNEIEAPDAPPGRLDSPAAFHVARDRRSVGQELAALLDQIRSLDGFESFLLPPEPDQLIRHAARGPIVVFNISQYRSDALILTSRAITHLPLPGLAFDKVIGQVNEFSDSLGVITDQSTGLDLQVQAEASLSRILEWLWDAAADPVLQHLGYIQTPAAGSQWPRVWWVPGGLLGLLPLHAAGYHRSADRSRTVLDRVISSYTPTIRALAHARSRVAKAPPTRALIVAMPTTPGGSPLGDVKAETALLRERLPSPTVLISDSLALNEHTPTKAAVIAHLPDAGIAHFSCHAASHPDDPSQSYLALDDHHEEPLTVASLVPIRLHHAQLAFLSACQTARNEATLLLDEALHLTAAFQLAGFPHVIGTLWSISDSIAADVADSFYTRLQTAPRTFDTAAAAQALHHAIRDLRDSRNLSAYPSLWAAFTHTGA